MSYSRDKENIFHIDIDKFNANLKKIFVCQLREVYGQAEQELEKICIHLGIRQSKENKIWNGIPMTAATFLFRNEDYMMEKGFPNNTEQGIDFGNMGIDEAQSREYMFNEMREQLKNRWPDYQEDNVIWGWGLTLLKYRTMEEDSEAEIMPGDFQVLWMVCNAKNDESAVSRLIMELMLELLQKYFKDITDIQKIGNCVNPQEAYKELLKAEQLDFMDGYVKLVFKKYKMLPTEKDCKKLSLTPYEKQESRGNILVIDEGEFYNEDKQDGKIIFDRERLKPFSEIRYTRKMLEACLEDHCLAIDSEEHKILGLMRKDLVAPQSLIIEYKGTANWSVKVGDEEILCYRGGSYFISKNEYNKRNRDLLSKIDGLVINKCEEIINELDKAKHGALMIIAEDAECHAERLCKAYERGTRIENFNLDKEENNLSMIAGMASVDGAVLVDFSGNCVAFGVILDGVAKTKGDFNSGSRYNSARNFIAGENMIAIIVSEDKDKGIQIIYGKDVGVG